MLAMVVVVLLPVGIALERSVTGFYYDQNTREMLDFGHRLADFVQRAPEPGASEAVRSIAQLAGTPIMLLDGEGRVERGRVGSVSEVGRQVQTPQVEAMFAGDSSVVLAVDETLPGALFVAAVPVWSEGEVVGGVLLFRSAGEVEAALKGMRTLLATAGLVLFG